MKRRITILGILAVIALVMTSCFNHDNTPTFAERDLLGLWQEDGTEAFVRFTTEQDETGEYKYGREWDESEDIFESDLLPYGNGWFKYKLVQSDLTEIHLMDNGSADIPKIYQVVKLNAGKLQYKDAQGKTYHFSKVVVL
jgi:hypothetical protein